MSDLIKSLESLKIPHYECEDGWYSCPLSEQGCFNEAQGEECTCGASKRNEVIDKAIAALKKAETYEEPNLEKILEQHKAQ